MHTANRAAEGAPAAAEPPRASACGCGRRQTAGGQSGYLGRRNLSRLRGRRHATRWPRARQCQAGRALRDGCRHGSCRDWRRRQHALRWRKRRRRAPRAREQVWSQGRHHRGRQRGTRRGAAVGLQRRGRRAARGRTAPVRGRHLAHSPRPDGWCAAPRWRPTRNRWTAARTFSKSEGGPEAEVLLPGTRSLRLCGRTDLPSDGIELQYGPGGFPPDYPGSGVMVPVPGDSVSSAEMIPDEGYWPSDDDDHPPYPMEVHVEPPPP